MRLGSSDVVVIGAGVIGTAVAYSLARSGMTVRVVERRGVGLEASGANVGLVTLFSAHSFDEPDPGPVFELTRASATAYATLSDEIGVDIEYERCGGVVFALDEERLAVIRRAFEGYRRHGVALDWLDERGVREREPAFYSDGIRGGIFCPDNGQLNPLMLCRAFAAGARRHGVTFHLGTAVEGIVCEGGRIRGVRTSAGDIACEFVVNAAGAWAAEVGSMVGVKVPVVPARGQIVLTEPVPRFIHHVLSGSEPSARQTRRGNVIIGSTVEDAGFDKRVTTGTIAEFAHGAVAHFPRLRGLRVIRSWAGLRPASPDHKPIIELVDEPAGFCLATGHSRRGICYAVGTGRLVTELLTGREPFLRAEAFSLARFDAAP